MLGNGMRGTSGVALAQMMSKRVNKTALFSSSASSGSRFQLEKDNDIAIVTMDDPTSKVNTISTAMQEDFSAMLDTVEKDDSIKAVVLISGKKDNFIAGADIKELAAFKTPQDGENASKLGQQLLQRVYKSKKPFIAAINGSCLGGGLEVALNCHYRIATSNKKTKLGLPEVQLGLLPGASGTQMLPKAIGLQSSLDMILTGKQLNADRARKMGVVHEVVDPHALRYASVAAAKEIVSGELKPKTKKKGIVGKLLEDNPLGRHILFDQATKMAMKKSQGNYPAIPAILDCLKTGAESGLEAGLKKESEEFGKLAQTPVCNALQGLFFGSTALKKNRFGEPKQPVKKIAVIGAGLMGAGITQITAQRGIDVILKDVNHAGLSRGISQIEKDLGGKVKKRRMTAYDRDVTMSRVVGLTEEDDWEKHFKDCDVVIEAVLENIDLKHKVIQQLEKLVPENCVIATNTSAIPIRDIAAGASRPENIVGLHYFSPVPMMPLLEIIQHEGTSQDALATAVSLGMKQGKTVVPAGDVPGFYVNRCLGPMLASTVGVVQDGVDLETIDKAMTKYGFPVGPITLADEVGIDVAYHVQETLSKDLGVRMQGGDASVLKDLMDAGILGRKSGKGFYTYAKGSKKKPLNPEAQTILKKYMKPSPAKYDTETIQQRIAFSFINEAMLCLQDGVIADPVDGDIGAVFGVGYPPFRGGPFRQIDQMGAQKFVDTMNQYSEKYGEQYKPAQIVVDLAKSGGTFHKEN